MKNKDIKKVAVLGIKGSFHELAAKEYFINEKIEVVHCVSFNDIISSVKNGSVDAGIMAIENSVAGSLLPNYTIANESGLSISGEIFIRIKQNLMALPNQSINDIHEVHSHPMALQQCEMFFKKYPNIKLIESVDTAYCAKNIATNKLCNIAAIAGINSAKIYGLEIIAEGIETNKRNFTRFWIIKKNSFSSISKDVNKSSLCFSLPHKHGSLSQVLSIFSFYNINLTKIQSLPIIGKEWEYLFYVDLVFENYERYKNSITAISNFSSNLKILGEYQTGRTNY